MFKHGLNTYDDKGLGDGDGRVDCKKLKSMTKLPARRRKCDVGHRAPQEILTERCYSSRRPPSVVRSNSEQTHLYIAVDFDTEESASGSSDKANRVPL